MLPLVSITVTTAIGCTSVTKSVMGVSFPLSRTSKSSCFRSGTRRPLESTTVA